MSFRKACGFAAFLAATVAGATAVAEDAPPALDATPTVQQGWPQSWEATEATSSPLTNFDRPSRTNAIMGRTMLVTAGLAAACVVAMVWSRRRDSLRSRPNSAEMQLLGTLTLAPRCYLQLVSINEQQFLIARDTSIVRSVTSVASFAATYDSFGERAAPPLGDPQPGPVGSSQRRALSTAFPQDAQATDSRGFESSSTAGLSLESHASSKPRLSELESSLKRSDPWQGSLPSHR